MSLAVFMNTLLAKTKFDFKSIVTAQAKELIQTNLLTIEEVTLIMNRRHADLIKQEVIKEILGGIVPVPNAPVPDQPLLLMGPEVAEVAEAPEVKKEKEPVVRRVAIDDCRCCARTFYEKEQLEGGKLKVMRDDEKNLYGDRCKFKKVGESEFCKHHAEKQPHGIWGGEYSGKMKNKMKKTLVQ